MIRLSRTDQVTNILNCPLFASPSFSACSLERDCPVLFYYSTSLRFFTIKVRAADRRHNGMRFLLLSITNTRGLKNGLSSFFLSFSLFLSPYRTTSSLFLPLSNEPVSSQTKHSPSVGFSHLSSLFPPLPLLAVYLIPDWTGTS